MRRGRVFIYLAFILILGLVAVAVVWFRSQPGKQTTAQLTPTPLVQLVDVVIVSQRVERGSVFYNEVLAMVPVPRDIIIEGYYTDKNQVIGKRARLDLEANMLLTSAMVAETAEQLAAIGSNAALSIPRGMVAMSIPIDRLSSASYSPQPGDHVNVLVTLLFVDLDSEFQSILPNTTALVLAPGPTAEGGPESLTASIQPGEVGAFRGRVEVDPLLQQTYYVVPSEQQRPRLVSQTLLQNIVVLQMGNFPLATEPIQVKAEPEQPALEETPQARQPEEEVVIPPPDIITLIVTPQDAVTLNYLIYVGARLTLVLRPAGDDSIVDTEAATLDFLLRKYKIPLPAKLPYNIHPRVDDLIPPVLPNDVLLTPVP